MSLPLRIDELQTAAQAGVTVSAGAQVAVVTGGETVRTPMSTFGASGDFLQAGTGAVTRTFQDKDRDIVSVKDFGAVGDGVTDDTAAFAAALLTGFNIYVPGVSNPATQFYSITAALTLNSNQRIFGDGWSSFIKQTGTSTLNTLTATSKDRVIVDGLHIYAGGGSTGSGGTGVIFTGCTKSEVMDCFVENPGDAGIMIFNSNDCKVTNNWISNGATAPIYEVDIYIVGSSSRNVVANNHCISGGDNGITIITNNTGTDAANDNIIIGNVIETHKMYGVNCYKFHATDTVLRNKVIGNSIKDITGERLDGGIKPYGAGIYIQGAEYSVVSNNTVETVGAQTNSDTLAPGAIGTTNVTNVVIDGNMCRNCTREGITVRDPNGTGLAVGGAVVSNNVVLSVTRTAIQVVERGNVNVIGNFIDTANRGILVNNTSTKRPNISIVGNNLNTISISEGIEVNFGQQVKISDNIVTAQAGDGIIVFDSDHVSVTGNTVVNGSSTAGTIGIQIRSTVTSAVVSDNFVTLNETGMTMGAACQIDNNFVTGNTTNWAGAFIISPNTQTGATYTVTRNDTDIIANRAGTVTLTLEAAASVIGKQLTVRTIQAQTVVSNASDVVPLAGGAAGTAILAATAGKWARLVSDGTAWQIMAGN